MNQQPTGILLKFTDFLNNRDSLAFLRLSHFLWFSHRSPSGRYRLKWNIEYPDYASNRLFLNSIRPSNLPSSFFADRSNFLVEFSPLGNFLLDSLDLTSLKDFRLFNRSREEFSTSKNDDGKRQRLSPGRRLFDGLKTMRIDFRFSSLTRLQNAPVEEIFPAIDLPQSLEALQVTQFVSLEKLFSFPENGIINFPNLRILDFQGMGAEPEGPLPRHFLSHPIIQQQEQLQTLKLPGNLEHPLEPGSLPPYLKELDLGYGFSSPLLPSVLPRDLETLRFHDDEETGFNHPLPLPLPSNLKELKLGNAFNQNILPGELPNGLKIIRLGSRFSQTLRPGVFPQGIEEISFGFFLNQPLPAGVFPASLKRFNCLLANTFSSSLDLPGSLESLDIFFEGDFPGPLPSFPVALQKLHIEGYNLPIESTDVFPPRLRFIDFGASFSSEIKPGIFPSTVEEINLPSFGYPLDIGFFPPGLKKISFGVYYQFLPVGIFPGGMKSIDLGFSYTGALTVGLFPSSVRELRISTKYPLLPGIFPEGVESIEFEEDFTQFLFPGVFPSSLRRLRFFENSEYQQPIVPGVLPAFLYQLNLGNFYHGHCPVDSLPVYFRPDVVKPEKIVCRLAAHQDEELPEEAKALLASYGPGEFLVNPLRVSIGPEKDSYVVLSPVSGDFPSPFIVHRSLIAISEKTESP